MILRLALVLILIGIAYLSLTPLETISVGNDKLGHFIAYTVLMTTIGLLTLPKMKSFRKGIIAALFYGALMEVGQYFVPGRFTSGYDMVANATGVLIGILITVLFHKSIKRLLKTARII
ncbi:MAG: VanZ family protein [Crocinitomicaceae bacterium]|nr:VanZ family protein [Crocinitomicaceae bacterium]